MKPAYCTLFDSKYLDKGLVLYNSLNRACDAFTLYVFAFDNVAEKILKKMALPHMVVVTVNDILTAELEKLRKERSRAEFCWTCTPIIIEYVIDNFGESVCTYIDADMMFFSDPNVLIEEMRNAGKTVQIVRHDYAQNVAENEKKYGIYCVEFNTFTDDVSARKVLTDWKNKCIEKCEQESLGDQRYLNSWPSEYACVHVLLNPGGGVAPWNLANFTLCNAAPIQLQDMRNGERFDLVFYHYQNIKYLPFGYINLSSGTDNRQLKRRIYQPYIQSIETVRRELKTGFNYEFASNRTTYRNPIKKFLQKYVRPFKCNNKGDIVKIKKLLGNK